jgi:putative endonuclease
LDRPASKPGRSTPSAAPSPHASRTKSAPLDARAPAPGVDARQALGKRAEAFVADKLVADGFTILARNARVGRLEIDLIARRGSLVVFCEVRARRSDRFMAPAESLDRRKLERVRRAAAGWLASSGLRGVDARLDVAALVARDEGFSRTYYEDAF